MRVENEQRLDKFFGLPVDLTGDEISRALSELFGDHGPLSLLAPKISVVTSRRRYSDISIDAFGSLFNEVRQELDLVSVLAATSKIALTMNLQFQNELIGPNGQVSMFLSDPGQADLALIWKSLLANLRALPHPAKSLLEAGNPMQSTTLPDEIRESMSRFRKDHPDPSKCAFVLMRFSRTPAHELIHDAVKDCLAKSGITALRADDKQYHDDLFGNVLTYIHGCCFGVAVFERIELENFNPNVALEVGYMLALRKPVCFLKDRTLTSLHSDLIGKLYRTFDTQEPAGTIPKELGAWLADKGLRAEPI